MQRFSHLPDQFSGIAPKSAKERTERQAFALPNFPKFSSNTIILFHQSHKPSCNNNSDHAAALARADDEGIDFGLPQGLTISDFDQKLEKWVRFHNILLMAATIHALGLPRDIKRSRSYMLRVKVSYREDHGGVTSKLFRLDDADVIDFDSARALGGVWPQSIEQLKSIREESEAQRRGSVAAVALECEPLAMQVVPFGSLRDLSPLKIQKDWKEKLRRGIESGKKLTRFEMTD